MAARLLLVKWVEQQKRAADDLQPVLRLGARVQVPIHYHLCVWIIEGDLQAGLAA